MGAVRGAERSTSAATEVGERTEQYSRTQAFLREHLASLLPIAERVFGPDHRTVTAIVSNLAGAYAELGRYEEALALARELHDTTARTLARALLAAERAVAGRAAGFLADQLLSRGAGPLVRHHRHQFLRLGA